jgi:small-conductance mechanosensitive channel
MEVLGVEEFGDSAVVIRVRFTTVPIQQWAVAREFRRRVKNAFDERGIEIPFPHRTLYLGEAAPMNGILKVRTDEGS